MAPPAGVNGVLPVAVAHKNQPAQPARGPKPPQPRLKLVCRRLPPGLTKTEFETALGNDWKLGGGRVDWLKYQKGKISKDAAKPSRPSRAYLHVSKNDHVNPLGDHVRATTFHDVAKSWQDPALVGPPTLEYAPYPKMPGGRRRNDNRQGTIDQDQDFKDFLESLTNPITKPPVPDADPAKDTKVKTTPLIEALREKKANKDKPNTKASRHARGDKDDSNDRTDKKILAKPGKENAPNAGDKNRRSTKGDKAQATKEAVKILNKEASGRGAAASSTDKASAAPERKRGNVALAKSMLQRDLGLGPGPTPSRRRGTKREVASASDAAPPVKEAPTEKPKATLAAQNATPPASDKTAQATQRKERPTRAERRAFKASLADTPNNNGKTAPADTKASAQPKGANTPAPQILKKPQPAQASANPKGQTPRNPPTEPAAARTPAPAKQQPAAKSEAPSIPAANTAKSAPPRPVPDATSKQAFLKHANPSQGITEPLIEEALKAFGGIQRVEIDKRKGFAYVDFAEPEGLQKAMAASPIKIAQGAVQVLERKEKVARNPRFNPPPTGPARGGRGGFAPRGRGRGGGARGGHASAAPAAVASGDAAT